MLPKSVRLLGIAGPSGVGKGEIGKKLKGLAYGPWRKKLHRLKTCTTRPRRASENDDNDQYHRATRAEFERGIHAGDFVEWVKNDENGEYYGLPVSEFESIPEGSFVLLELNIDGACVVKRRCPEVILVFVAAPSWRSLWRRLRGRGTESFWQCLKRMRIALREMWALPHLLQADVFSYVIVNHDDGLERAVSEAHALLEGRDPFPPITPPW